MTTLTTDEKATNHETWTHINQVREFLQKMAYALIDRALAHDQSKLKHPEVQIFTEFTAKLAGLTYGSDEYKQCLKDMGPALTHHYARNRHHPEHFADGVNDMNLLDLVEMLCDWKAATLRHNDGNLNKSLEINAKRFSIDSQLARILHNTARLLEGDPP